MSLSEHGKLPDDTTLGSIHKIKTVKFTVTAINRKHGTVIIHLDKIPETLAVGSEFTMSIPELDWD